MCVGAKKKTSLICQRYTRLTLPPFHLFNEKNIRSSNSERLEIGNDLLLTHTRLEVVTWELVGVWREDGVGRRWVCVCFPSSTTTQSFMDHGNFQGL